MRKIICPIDFSDISLMALQYAVEIADLYGGNLILLHAFHLPALEGKVPMTQVVLEQNKKTATKKLAEMSETINAKYKRRGSFAHSDFLMAEGLLADTLEALSKKEHPVLIVMGTLGATGLGDYLLGSNTSRVINNVNIPVLLIPFDCRFNRVGKIVYGTALDKSELPAIKFLMNFSKQLQASLKIIHISHPDSKIVENTFAEFKEMVENETGITNASWHLEYHKDELEGINKYLKRNKADVFAIYNKKRTLISKLFDDTITDDLIFHSDLPLLCIN